MVNNIFGRQGLVMEEKLVQLQAKLEADKGLVEKLFGLETPEEVQSLLKEQELDFNLEEINSFKDAITKAVQKRESGNLSDEDLEDVAGGIIVPIAIAVIPPAIGITTVLTRGRW